MTGRHAPQAHPARRAERRRGAAAGRSDTGYDAVKRVVDVLGALTGLLAFAPLIVVVAFVVLRDLGRPVLLRQERPGRDGVPFQLVKFRTMRPVDEAAGLVSDADRLTRTGRRLRAASLAELPTLVNVLRGEMSLVGPRPLLTRYLARYSPEQARRHEARPGMTGLVQVRGRNGLSWEEKLALDVWYVDNRCLRLDARILAGTVRAVLRRDGISADGHATAPEFWGSPSDQRRTAA